MPRRPSNPSPHRPPIDSDAVLRVQKYPNRRLYDRTNSRHLTNDQLHALIAEGRRVQVTDSRTGEDITNVVLAQLLLEHDPLKLAAFPPELLHLLIRSSHRTLPSVQRIMAEATAGLARGWTEWQSWGERMAALFGGAGHGTPSAESAEPRPRAEWGARADHPFEAGPMSGPASSSAHGGGHGPSAPTPSARPPSPMPLSGFLPWLPGSMLFSPTTQRVADEGSAASGHAAGSARPDPAGQADLESRLLRLQSDVARLEQALGQRSAKRTSKAAGGAGGKSAPDRSPPAHRAARPGKSTRAAKPARSGPSARADGTGRARASDR